MCCVATCCAVLQCVLCYERRQVARQRAACTTLQRVALPWRRNGHQRRLSPRRLRRQRFSRAPTIRLACMHAGALYRALRAKRGPDRRRATHRPLIPEPQHPTLIASHCSAYESPACPTARDTVGRGAHRARVRAAAASRRLPAAPSTSCCWARHHCCEPAGWAGRGGAGRGGAGRGWEGLGGAGRGWEGLGWAV